KRAHCLKTQPATDTLALNLIYSTKPLRWFMHSPIPKIHPQKASSSAPEMSVSARKSGILQA
ncbi:hypothetical protein, partial [Pantoea dispersa]|uniref:hypothetical protein n=1 Tax=Pantoea dispersa TaxID=59814 RepID=UPI001C8B2321